MAKYATVHSSQLNQAEAECWHELHENRKGALPRVTWQDKQWVLMDCAESHNFDAGISGYIFKLRRGR